MRSRSLVPLLAVAIGLTIAAGPARADFYAGLEAYQAKDCKTAYEIWLPLAESGHARAQFALGWLNGSLGCRVFVTDELAAGDHSNYGDVAYEGEIKWLTLAAEQGLPKAQYWLAEAYVQGKMSGTYGVEPDVMKALFWLRRSANQGYFRAMHALAAYLIDEKIEQFGAKVDRVEALTWWILYLKHTCRCRNFALGSFLRSEFDMDQPLPEILEAQKRARAWREQRP